MPAPTPWTRLSIKTSLAAAVGSLALLLVLLAGWRVADSWAHLASASVAARSDADGNRLVVGLYETLLERLATNNALQAAEPASAEVLKTIEARRASIAGKYPVGLAGISGGDFPDRATLLPALAKAREAADAARRQADAALRLPKAQRNPDLLKNFIPVVTASVAASLDVWLAALHETAKDDPVLARLAVIKQIGWTMREYAGRERSNIAQAISSASALQADKRVENAAHRARVDVLWQQLDDLVRDEATHPAIKRAMADAADKFFKGFAPLADQLRDAAGTYPMDAAKWVEISSPQIDSLIAILYAASEASEARTATLLAGARTSILFNAGALVLGILVAAACFVLVSRRVVRPLSALNGTVMRLAENDTAVTIPGTERQDELGQLARAVDVLRGSMIEADRLRAEQAATDERQARRATELAAAVASFQGTIDELSTVIAGTSAELQAAAGAATDSIGETAAQASTVAAAATGAAQNVQTVASAAEELSASIREIADRVTQSSAMTSEAAGQARRSTEEVKGLTEAASRIGQVVQLIADIASQTNLLALNATTEAARAGDAGKGFAVVASEVKTLATQTARATDEIAGQIRAIQDATQVSARSIEEVAGSIVRISESATAIAAAIEQQGAATQEIARSVDEAAGATTAVTDGMARASERIGAAATEVQRILGSASALSEKGGQLRGHVERFVAAVKAA